MSDVELDKLKAIPDFLLRLNEIADNISNRLSIVLDTLAKSQETFQYIRDTVQKMEADQLQSRISIMNRIDRLQDTVALAQEDTRVNWATANTAINRARNSREDIDDLHKLIEAMERRYQTLAAVVDELRKPEIKKPDSL
jgi:hypothetical protein